MRAIDLMGNEATDPQEAPDSVYTFVVGGVGIVNGEAQKFPVFFSLSQNYPNPFNPATVIRYSIPKGSESRVLLSIYNLHGRLVRTLIDEVKSFGTYSISWDGKDVRGISVSSGLYFYRLQVGDFTSTRKMTLLR